MEKTSSRVNFGEGRNQRVRRETGEYRGLLSNKFNGGTWRYLDPCIDGDVVSRGMA